MISRRSLLVSGVGVAGFATVNPAFAASKKALRCRVFFDAQLAAGRDLAEAALIAGMETLDTGGEPVIALTDSHKYWLHGSEPLVGFTRYSEYMQIEDMARRQGRYASLVFHSDVKGRRHVLTSNPFSEQALASAEFLLGSVRRNAAEGIGWVIA